jgi:chemotaxis protein MotB
MGALKKVRSHEAEVDTDGSWAISYGDMITLLLTFFILFFSTNKDRDRMQAMESTLAIKLDSSYKAQGPQTGAIQQKSDVAESMGPQQLNAKVYKVGDRMIVEFPNASFFNLGKVELTKEGTRELHEFVKRYMPYAGNYILGIRAYTDNKKVKKRRGRFRDNLELSALRSVATMRTLQKLGIPLNRMRLGGYGELNLTAAELEKAVANEPNYNTNGIALARKVVLVIEPEVKELL